MLNTLQFKEMTYNDLKRHNEGMPNLFKSTAELATEKYLIDSAHEKKRHLRSMNRQFDQTILNAFEAEVELTDQMGRDTNAKHHTYYVVRQQTQDRLYQDVLNSAKPKTASASIKNIKPTAIKPETTRANTDYLDTPYKIAEQQVANAVDRIARVAIRKHQKKPSE